MFDFSLAFTCFFFISNTFISNARLKWQKIKEMLGFLVSTISSIVEERKAAFMTLHHAMLSPMASRITFSSTDAWP